jgi:hypothetical protein
VILPTPRPSPRPVGDDCRALVAQPGLPFASHLPEPHVHVLCRAQQHTFRPRIYTPAVTPWAFLSQCLDQDHSCEHAVDRLLAYRAARALPDCSADTGAYGKARARLPEALLRTLVRQAGRGQMAKADRHWLWKGRQVKVVDGTGLSMPDTPENQKEEPQSQRIRPGVGFPLMRLVVVFPSSAGAVLDAAVARWSGQGLGEVSLFRRLGDVLDSGDVPVADRIYATFWDVARAKARGIAVVMRWHAGRRPVWLRGRGHGTANRRVWWTKPQRPGRMTQEEYETYPKEMRWRAVRVDVRQRGFRTKRYVLITTLTDATAYRARDLAELYRRRWPAELNLRALKTVLPMDILRGKTPGLVRKEVWAHRLAYNLIRGMMAEAARRVALRPDQLSFTGAPHAVNAFLPKLPGARTAAARRLWGTVLALIGRRRVGERPDRVEPRQVKRRPKKFPKLTVPRAEARRQLLRDATRKGPKT